GLGRVLDVQGVHRDDVRGDGRTGEVDLPVGVVDVVGGGQRLVVLGQLDVADVTDGGAGAVEVDVGVDLVLVGDVALVVVLDLLVTDGVEVTARGAPLQQEVDRVHRRAVRPLVVVGE